MKTAQANSVFIGSNKQTKAQIREFLQKEFAIKYFYNPNLNLFPMSKYYQEFQSFLQTQISNLEQSTQIQLNPEQREKTVKAVEILWLYDLRKIASDQKYYPQIIKNVFNSIVTNEPITLIQWGCTKRNKLSNSWETYVQTNAEGSNLLPNLPFLKLVISEFKNAEIPIKIIPLFADSENWWVDLQEGQNLNINPNDLSSILKPQWDLATANLQQEVDLIIGFNVLKLIQTSDLEIQMKNDNQFDFGQQFEQFRQVAIEKFNLNLIARMSLVWKNVLEGNQRSAFADAENELGTTKFANVKTLSDLQSLIPAKYIEITARQLAEYGLQGEMLRILAPNAILLQNERPIDEKNDFYNSLRKDDILPEICPYFYQ